MKKILRSILRPFLVLALSACVATTGEQQASYTSIDSDFAPLLGREYQVLAALMKANGQSETAAEFDSKAADSQSGRWAYPDAPLDNGVQGKAYNDLTGALMFFMNGDNAPWLAKAQANYDCWVNTPSDDGCQRNFEKAMRSLIVPAQIGKTESVYFSDDSSVLDDAAYKNLTGIANQARMNKSVVLNLTGHSGGGVQNSSLALRRAIAIRNVLAQMGVAPDRISVDDESHSDTILSRQKTETGTDPKTHRVDIQMEPVLGREI